MAIESSPNKQTASLKRVYMSRAQLARHFNVTERALSKIIKRKRWRKMKNMGSHAIYSLLETELNDEGDGRRTYGQVSRATRDKRDSSTDASSMYDISSSDVSSEQAAGTLRQD